MARIKTLQAIQSDYEHSKYHQKVCFKLFSENVCGCCRFGKKDMCSDLIMSSLEEASRGIENAMKSDLQLLEQMRTCNCAYHQHRSLDKATAQKDGANLSNNNEVSDSSSVGSNESEYDLLYDYSRSDNGSSSNTEVDDSSSISNADSDTDCSNGDENSINLCKWGDKSWEEGDCLIADFVQKQGKDQICKTCCLAQQCPELAKCSIFGNSSSKKITPYLIYLDCVNVCEKCGVDKTFPEILKCPVFFNNETTQNGEGEQSTLYQCKVWKPVSIARTTRTQKELVEEKMTISELIDHYLKCLTDARLHYVKYKIIDWCQSTFKFNTKTFKRFLN